MTKHHVCGFSLLLSAFFLSGCGTMVKKETTSIETGTVTPLVVDTPASEDITASEATTSKTLVDTMPNTNKVTTTQILPKKSKTKKKVAVKKKKTKGCRA